MKKKLLRSGIRSLDLLIMSKMSYYLSYHDTHTINEEKVLYKVLKEECEQEVNNFVYLFCKHINQRSITTNFHFDSIDSFLSRGYVSAHGKIMYCAGKENIHQQPIFEYFGTKGIEKYHHYCNWYHLVP